MKQLCLTLLLLPLPWLMFAQSQIIADHTIVADYDIIPDYYINQVKKMFVSFPGASHSSAYRTGLVLLENLDDTYQVNVSYEEAYTTSYLRCNSIEGYMQEDAWYTWYAWPENERPAAAQTVKNMIKSNFDNNRLITAIGFGWCWDMMSSYCSQMYDTEHKVRWWGISEGGPDAGTLGWGLNDADYAITNNRVSMDTYLNATLDYITYCANNGYPTKVVFTTGPVDKYTGEQAYQAYVKHKYIRDFVGKDATRILFDYADILCYDDNGNAHTESWTHDGVTYTFPFITVTNLGDGSVGHIAPAGALRLGKAIWWMLARMAGWDGESTSAVNQDANVNQPGYTSYIQDGEFFIHFDNPSLYNGTCAIHSLQGVLFEEKKIVESTIVINTQDYPSGVYLITLSGERKANFKVVLP